MMGTMGNSDGSDAPAVLAVLKTYKTSHLVKVILRLRGCAARSSEFLERGDVEHALIATLRGDDVTSPEGVQAAIAACGVHRTTGEDTMGAKSTVYQGSSSAAAATNPSDASGGEATEAALPPASTEASSATAATSSGAVPGGAAGDDGATNDAANGAKARVRLRRSTWSTTIGPCARNPRARVRSGTCRSATTTSSQNIRGVWSAKYVLRAVNPPRPRNRARATSAIAVVARADMCRGPSAIGVEIMGEGAADAAPGHCGSPPYHRREWRHA